MDLATLDSATMNYRTMDYTTMDSIGYNATLNNGFRNKRLQHNGPR